MAHIFQSEHVLALLSASFIFLITIFLVVKRWIGFSTASLLLLFSLAAGFLIDHMQIFPHDAPPSSSFNNETSQEVFQQHMLQAVEDLKTEVLTEKENLRRVMKQVQEVFDSVDVQKQKLQNFIEETREHFKTDYPSNISSQSQPSSLQTQVQSETETTNLKL